MISKLGKYNIYYKCSILSGFFLALISLGLIPLYFFSLKEIPLGILLGGGLGIISYLIVGILEDKRSTGYKWAVVVSIVRYFVFALLLLLLGLCYYKWEIKIFNIFGFVGGYLLVTIIFVIIYLLTKHQEERKDGSI